MKVNYNEPKFSGLYASWDDSEVIDYLRNSVFYQKTFKGHEASFEGKDIEVPPYFYFITCFKNKNHFWHDVFSVPLVNEYKNYTKEQAFGLYLQQFDLKKHRYKQEGKWRSYEAVMPRTVVPDEYKDLISYAGNY